MVRVLNLESLLQIKDPSDFGLKTGGLVNLNQFMQKFDPKKIDIRYPINIPNFFAVSDGANLEGTELKEQYFRLTSDLIVPSIILARSSDKNEMPGRFETHSSLYDPNNKEQSFLNWVNAARKVRDSGAKAIIGQQLVGKLENFRYDKDYDTLNNYNEIPITIESFGGSNSSFVGRSHSFIYGPIPSITACFGLATKIVRGDKDVSLIQLTKYGKLDVINLANDYQLQSFGEYKQHEVDIISLKDPEKITTLTYGYPMIHVTYQLTNSQVPFMPHFFSDENYYGFNPSHLLELTKEIGKFFSKPIEIEGCVNREGIHLWQLREYDLPQKHFENLSSVSENIIIKQAESIGFNQFKGDLLLSYDIFPCKEGQILGYLSPINPERLPLFEKHNRMVFDMPEVRIGAVYEASHKFGYTVQLLSGLEKLHCQAIAIQNLDQLISEPINGYVEKINNRTFIIKNVTIESNGYNSQIYLNR